MASEIGSCSSFSVNGASETNALVVNNGIGGEKLIFQVDIGHESELIPPNPREHTHRWRLFLRAANGTVLDQDIIQKVIFQLHDDFPNAKRVVKVPPYEVTETGYAGFTIPIFVYLVGCKQEFSFQYTMDLSYDKSSLNKITKNLEIKNPKPALRAKLIGLGAEVEVVKAKPCCTAKKEKGKVSRFEDLFGPTIALQQSISRNVPKEKVCTKTKAEKWNRKELEVNIKNEVPEIDVKQADPRLSLSPPTLKRETPAGEGEKVKDETWSKKGKKKQSDLLRTKCEKKSKSSHSAEKVPRPLNETLLRDLIVAVGGDISDVESIASRPSLPPCESPIFQTGDSPDHESESCSKKPRSELKGSISPAVLSNATKSGEKSEKSVKKRKKKRLKQETPCAEEEYVGLPNGEEVKRETVVLKTEADPNNHAQTSGGKCEQTEMLKPVAVAVGCSEDEHLSRLKDLQQRIMTVNERHTAQKLANVIFRQASFDIKEEKFLEFDLCSLSLTVIDQLFKCLEGSE